MTLTPTVAGVTQDHPRLGSDMIYEIILSMAEENSKISVPILIVNIHNQYDYTLSYYKAWIAKQKDIEKMHKGWDESYNYFIFNWH